MLALALLFAFTSREPSSASLQLDVSEPSAVADAMDTCRSAVGQSVEVGEARLLSDGWKPADRPNNSVTVFRRTGTAALILKLAPPLADSCLVRARLQDDASVIAARQAIEQRLGVPAQGRERGSLHQLWRASGQVVGLEAFDDGPGSQRHVIQLVVGELPRSIDEHSR